MAACRAKVATTGPCDVTAPDVRITSSGGVSVATAPAVIGGGWIGWAKRGQIVAACPFDEPGEVWIGDGSDRDALERALLAEAGGLH